MLYSFPRSALFLKNKVYFVKECDWVMQNSDRFFHIVIQRWPLNITIKIIFYAFFLILNSANMLALVKKLRSEQHWSTYKIATTLLFCVVLHNYRFRWQGTIINTNIRSSYIFIYLDGCLAELTIDHLPISLSAESGTNFGKQLGL